MNTPIDGDSPGDTPPGTVPCTGGVDLSLLDADLTTLGTWSADELLNMVSDAAVVLRRAEALLVAGSNEVAIRSDKARGADGLAARHGFARPSQLVEQITGVSGRTASRYIRVGALTGQRVSETGMPLPALFPLVGDALSAGWIGVDAAEAITKELSQAAPRADLNDLTAAEAALVGQATGQAVSNGLALPADLVAGQARLWRDALDPNGIEPRTDEAFQERDLWVGRTAHRGVVPFGGKLTVDVAAKLTSLFDAMLTPRTAPQCVTDQEQANQHDRAEDDPTLDGAELDGTELHGAGLDGVEPGPTRDGVEQTPPEQGRPKDTRTPGQQRADIFAAMIDSLARSAEVPTISGAAPTVLVTVPAQVLADHQGTGLAVGVTDPVPYSAIEQILCDGGVQPVFIGPHGEIVAMGTKQRKFTRAQKLAIIARDGPTCHECDIPASGCEVHHVIPWSEGGKTEVSNGVILCWFDHHKMHAGEWRIEMIDGKPVSIPPPWLQRKPYFH